MFDTPILFILFKRPETTQRVFDVIKSMRPTQLFIAADGPRKEIQGEAELCERTRSLVIENIDWDCEVKTLFQAENLGCGRNPAGAITWFFEHVEEGIILEDDCVPSLGFFNYCSELLAKYRNDDKVYVVGSNNFTGQKFGDASYYFTAYGHTWGWATWRRAWKNYDYTLQSMTENKLKRRLKKIFPNNQQQEHWLRKFRQMKASPKDDIWDFQWSITQWYNGGIGINPNLNLVRNIGFGEGSTHTTIHLEKKLSIEAQNISSLIHPKKSNIDTKADLVTFYIVFERKKPSGFLHNYNTIKHTIKLFLIRLRVIDMPKKPFVKKTKTSVAPIVLFVYNRPEHVRRTIDALSKNELIENSDLIVFSDGPNEDDTTENIAHIQEVRNIIKHITFCKNLTIIESQTNKGLANSIIDGVTKVVNEYGKVIVLEDDIITSPGFLKYMNDALHVYEHEERVMHISGYMYPVEQKLPPTYFFKPATCWGWATWSRAWKHLEIDAQLHKDKIDKTSSIETFNIENGYDYYEHLKANAENRIRTWAIKWYASIFLKKGLSLHPYPSLTNNIGHDGQGVHFVQNDMYLWKEIAQSIEVVPQPLVESIEARKAFASFFQKRHFKVKQYEGYYKKQIKKMILKFIPKSVSDKYYTIRNSK